MRNKPSGVLSITFAIFLGCMIIFITSKTIEANRVISIERENFIKDSIETEQIKKLLKSYPYDHSEIKDTIVKNN
jgi:hypothetical protein